ncbi:hypothetical protein [Blastococcus sp. CCUG 61487]|uniref:hypothetical protein n=1 Tax=Blastococcus sp. CCUG 61487 TaxID=1840703 RepID=UPI0010C0279F|nr:hypothetical protein [Blastococcus sp. CCUG 61487]TKJ24345.1 hypothetical protein A6V29_04930 [Blastococcus sp. CCUG 61487]
MPSVPRGDELERIEWVEGQVPLPDMPHGQLAAGDASELGRLTALGVNRAAAAVLAAGPGPRPKKTRELPREHGSERGYRQHIDRGETTCPPCRAAHAAYNDEHVVRWPA